HNNKLSLFFVEHLSQHLKLLAAALSGKIRCVIALN
ncbi:MAG: hypothetical protein ACI85S_002171, partial [Pseudohongiellaceae bacterium]